MPRLRSAACLPGSSLPGREALGSMTGGNARSLHACCVHLMCTSHHAFRLCRPLLTRASAAACIGRQQLCAVDSFTPLLKPTGLFRGFANVKVAVRLENLCTASTMRRQATADEPRPKAVIPPPRSGQFMRSPSTRAARASWLPGQGLQRYGSGRHAALAHGMCSGPEGL